MPRAQPDAHAAWRTQLTFTASVTTVVHGLHANAYRLNTYGKRGSHSRPLPATLTPRLLLAGGVEHVGLQQRPTSPWLEAQVSVRDAWRPCLWLVCSHARGRRRSALNYVCVCVRERLHSSYLPLPKPYVAATRPLSDSVPRRLPVQPVTGPGGRLCPVAVTALSAHLAQWRALSPRPPLTLRQLRRLRYRAAPTSGLPCRSRMR